MEVVKIANRTHVHGNCCSEFVRDTYEVELRLEDMYICIDDNDVDLSTSICLNPKDAIKLAETILEYYKSKGF